MMEAMREDDVLHDRVPWCESHGERRHACVHEAGHAIAAVDCGIPIVSLTVHHEPTTFDGARPGETASGAVRIDVDTLAALRAAGHQHNRDLFTFALAGEAAEKVILGHETPRGAARDVREFWAWTKGQTFTSMDEYREVLGEPLEAALARVASWAQRRASHIDAVARLLGELGSVTVRELTSIGEDWRI